MKAGTALAEETVEHGLACFYLDDGIFSVNIRLVREINPHLGITPARNAPSFVRGLVNLRGQIVTVIDLGERIGIGSRTVSPESRLVILKTNGELDDLRNQGVETSNDKVGLLVDRIADVVTPSQDDLEASPPNLNGVEAEYLAGVCKTEDSTIGILNVPALLRHEERKGRDQSTIGGSQD